MTVAIDQRFPGGRAWPAAMAAASMTLPLPSEAQASPGAPAGSPPLLSGAGSGSGLQAAEGLRPPQSCQRLSRFWSSLWRWCREVIFCSISPALLRILS